jgi:hypothetical protein
MHLEVPPVVAGLDRGQSSILEDLENSAVSGRSSEATAAAARLYPNIFGRDG